MKKSEEKKLGNRNYCSPTTGEFCTVQQYITELVCLRAFKRYDIGPSYKFWNKEEMGRYKGTIMAVSLLCREYGAPALLDYLNTHYNIFYVGFYKKIPDYVREGILKSVKKLETRAIQEKNSIISNSDKEEVVETYIVCSELVGGRLKSKGLFGRLKNN